MLDAGQEPQPEPAMKKLRKAVADVYAQFPEETLKALQALVKKYEKDGKPA